MGSGNAPGRPLPLRAEDITSTKVNDEAKELIVELLTLVRTQFSSVRNMIRFAMARPDRPVWAVGSPSNERHLSSASSAVSKFLGRAAERAPDWPDIVWIVRACSHPADREQVLARMAGRWCAATAASWPPGYVGLVDHGDDAVERLTDPDHAPDDATRAELYHQQLRDAQASITRLLQDKQELQLQVDALTASTAHAGQRISDLESAYQYKDSELGEKVLANRRRFELHVAQLQLEHTQLHREHAEKARRVDDRLHQVNHHLAVLVAHLVSTGQTDDLLPLAGLGVDTELRDLLDPPTPPDTPVAGWLVAYLRAMVLLHHGLDYPAVFFAIADNLTSVVAHGTPPDHDTINALLDAYPMLRAYAGPLHRAAQSELTGRPVALTSVDTRTPTEQRLQDANTVQLPGHPARRRHPPPPPTAPRRLVPPPTNPKPPTVLPLYSPGQVTVAELLARHGHVPPRRHGRHRLPPPPTDQSG